MKVELIDEARDIANVLPVLQIKREREAIVLVTPSLTILVGPATDFLNQAIDLLGPEDRD